MNRQEYYDLLVKTSLEGGFPSRDANNCLYLSPEGKMCAVGVLIPKEFWDGKSLHIHNKHSVNRVAREFPELLQYLPDESTEGLDEVQSAHDCTAWKWKTGTLLWNHQEFLTRLNNCDYFKNVEKVKPKEDTQ